MGYFKNEHNVSRLISYLLKKIFLLTNIMRQQEVDA